MGIWNITQTETTYKQVMIQTRLNFSMVTNAQTHPGAIPAQDRQCLSSQFSRSSRRREPAAPLATEDRPLISGPYPLRRASSLEGRLQ